MYSRSLELILVTRGANSISLWYSFSRTPATHRCRCTREATKYSILIFLHGHANTYVLYFYRHMFTCLALFYDVLLTVYLSIFILVINQLDAQNLFYYKFISRLYMFRAPCANRQEVKIVLYGLWYHHTYRWPSRAQDGHL